MATAALVADKTVLSPQTALASVDPLSPSVDAVDPASKSGASPESVTANLRVVSDRADAGRPVNAKTDPFAWRLPQTQAEPVTVIRTFLDVTSAWSVSSIMGTADSRLAVINGRAVRVNESLAFSTTDSRAIKVVEIREGHVVLYHDGQTATLNLPTTTLSGVE